MKRSRLLALAATVLLAGAGGLYIVHVAGTVPRLFRRNAELKAQGYYLGTFEFKLLAAQQALNEGHYREAGRILRRIEAEMAEPVQLPKVPADGSPEAQRAFLLARQDPDTGAFMDPAYPLFTWFAPTDNAVEQLRALGGGFRLQHPLRFLERLERPEQLRAYLDSLLYLRPWVARLPGPGPYGPGVSELAYYDELEEAGVARFSPEWQHELRRWFQETQDPATGFWGARLGDPSHWRQKLDINSTYHVLHLVVDERGADRSAEFPLLHADALAQTLLGQVGAPMPEGEDAQHDWGLTQTQGAGLLTRRLWLHLDAPRQEAVRTALQELLTQRARLFRPGSHGFAYYASQPQADMDGTGLALGLFHASGAIPGIWERERLWGDRLRRGPVRKTLQLHHWSEASALEVPPGGSLRFYLVEPKGDSLDDKGLVHIHYPGPGCDVLELRRELSALLASPEAAYGNWTSKASLRDEPLALDRPCGQFSVSRGPKEWETFLLREPRNGRLYALAVDAAQVPRTLTELVRR